MVKRCKEVNMMKKLIVSIIIILLFAVTVFAWSWNSIKDTTFSVLKDSISLDIHDERSDWETISVFHDNDRNVTCWISQSRFGEGLSCIADIQFKENINE